MTGRAAQRQKHALTTRVPARARGNVVWAMLDRFDDRLSSCLVNESGVFLELHGDEPTDRSSIEDVVAATRP